MSCITSMRGLFKNKLHFDADLGGWDVSHVNDMSHMFWDALVTSMAFMFAGAASFNGAIGGWNVAAATEGRGPVNPCPVNAAVRDGNGIHFERALFRSLHHESMPLRPQRSRCHVCSPVARNATQPFPGRGPHSRHASPLAAAVPVLHTRGTHPCRWAHSRSPFPRRTRHAGTARASTPRGP